MPSSRAAKPINGLPDYGAPPLVEVACGLSFSSIQKLKVPHYGLFWTKILEEFPQCEHAPPIGEPPESLGGGNYFLPRIWFINEPGDNLIQLQADRFHFNWRQLQPENQYPRYPVIIEKFKRHFANFSSFLAEHHLGSIEPTECELTYVNQIPQGMGWNSIEEIGSLLKDVSWDRSRKSFLPPPEGVAWVANFQLPSENGTFRVSLKQAKRRADNKPVIMIELSAKGLPQQRSIESIWSWYDLAHEWIVRGFSDITDDNAQIKLWKRL